MTYSRSIYNEQPDRMRRFLRSLAVSEKESQWVPDLASSLIAIYEANANGRGGDSCKLGCRSTPVPL